MSRVVIVGSGLAGHRAAAEISRLDPACEITVVGEEQGLPYDRPPLSKEVLLSADGKPVLLGPPDFYVETASLRAAQPVSSIDRAARRVMLSGGGAIPYDQLLLATGSRLRRLSLPEVSPSRVFYLRTVEDAARLRLALRSCDRVCVIGGGFIGLEVAAAARMLGRSVVVLEGAGQLIARGATASLGDYLLRMHEANGVEVVLGAKVESAWDDGDGVSVQTTRGRFGADLIVVGIGVQPNTELARAAGLEVDDGIVVDSACRTADPRIFAAGEVTRYPLEKFGVRLRTESWTAASSQATIAARAMLGENARHDELPWFWSDQFQTNVQSLGLPFLARRFVRIGDASASKWVRIGLGAKGELVSAEGVNAGREISALRRADRKGEAIPSWLLEAAEGDIAAQEPDQRVGVIERAGKT